MNHLTTNNLYFFNDTKENCTQINLSIRDVFTDVNVDVDNDTDVVLKSMHHHRFKKKVQFEEKKKII